MLARERVWVPLLLLDALEQVLQRLTLCRVVLCVEPWCEYPCENLTDTHSFAEVCVIHAPLVEATLQAGPRLAEITAIVVVVEDVEQVVEQVLLVADVGVASSGALDGVGCCSHCACVCSCALMFAVARIRSMSYTE